ncbi:MAG: Ig-like domain-containing protein [Bacilli bacterium]|nr:Ig-like domain-containing protein [Bacilli bacterium]
MNKRYLLLVSATLVLASCNGKPTTPAESSSPTPSESSLNSEASSQVSKEESKVESSVSSAVSSESIQSSSSSEKQIIYVSSIVVDNAPTVMEVNESVRLSVSVSPENADNTKVTYSSSNPSVADVSRTTLNAYAPGKATITITAADGGGASASFEVTVKEPIVAPSTWEDGKKLLEDSNEKTTNISGYTYNYKYTTYKEDSSLNNVTEEIKQYVYGEDGNVAYTGTHSDSASGKSAPIAGFKGIEGDKFYELDHTYSTYDYRDEYSKAGGSINDTYLSIAREISEFEEIFKYVEQPSKWNGTKSYTGVVEDDLIKIKYSHEENGYQYSYKGSLEATINPQGELLDLKFKDTAYFNPDFEGIRYTYEYSIDVKHDAKAKELPVGVSDFHLTSNYQNFVRTYGSKEDNVALVGNYIQFEAREPSQTYAVDYLQENFEIVSSSDTSIIGKKKDTDTTYYALSEGQATLTIKRKSTGEAKDVVVTCVKPDATSFDTIKSSEGINMSVGKITTFTANLKPVEADQLFSVASSDETLMRVYNDGGVWYGEALKAGTVTITFSTSTGLCTPKTLDITIKEAPAETPKYVGTWTHGSNTLVLEANGNATWNGTHKLTFTYDESTGIGKINPHTVFDGEDNYFKYNAGSDTVEIVLWDEYYETGCTDVLSRVGGSTPSTPTKSFAGNWTTSTVSLVIEENGNGTWNGYAFTFTYDEKTHKLTVSNFANYDDDENVFTWNPDNDTLTIHVSGCYGDDIYNAVATRA